jgi:ATP-dependent DNA helicase RecQ
MTAPIQRQKDIAGKKPRTLSAMLEVSGVGERKLEQYGELFLHAITEVV